MRSRVWLAMLVAGVAMGTGGVSVRAALNRGVPPYALTLVRALFALAAIVAALSLRRRRPTLDRVAWRVGVVMGVAGFGAPFLLWTLALRHAGAGFVGLVSALYPIVTAAIAHYLLPGEPLRTERVAGLMMALAGVAVLLLAGDAGFAEGGRPLAAGLLTIAAVILSAFCGVYAKRHAGRYEPLEVSGIQFFVGAGVIAGVMLAVEGVPGGLTTSAWGILAYSGVITTALPTFLLFWLLRHVTATYAAASAYLSPVMAVLSGAVILDERLTWGIAAGGALILVGMLLTDRAESAPSRGAEARRGTADHSVT